MIGIIVAMNADRVIGVNGTIPWRYPGDLARFKRLTMGSTVIMGRKTWESIPAKYRPLPERENIVLSADETKVWDRRSLGRPPRSLYVVKSIKRALKIAGAWRCPAPNVWFIGGVRIYTEAMQYADVIDVTHVPWFAPRDTLPSELERTQVYFPPIDEALFCACPWERHPDDAALEIQRFERRYELKDNRALQEAGLLTRSHKE